MNQVVLLFVGGLAFFLYGIALLQKGLKKAGAKKLRSMVNSLAKNRFLGLITGGVITALLQSSSASTVMFVGLASAGVLSLAQAVPLILGGNIGTTLTVQIISFKLSDYSLLLIAIGVMFRIFSDSKRLQSFGQVVLGFGMVFYGMHVMAQAAEPLKGSPYAATVAGFLKNYPFYGLLLGAVFTAVIQGSAATIGLVISLAHSGIVDLHGAIPIVLGANIGTCATALLAGLAAKPEGKRIAGVHILVKTVGALLLLPFLDPFTKLVEASTPGLSHQIANAHTFFNIGLALLFLPLTNVVAKAGEKLFKEPEKQSTFGALFLDKRSLPTPSLAFANVQREILRMAEIVQQMMEQGRKLYTNPELGDEIQRMDDKVDILYEDIKFYLARLSQEGLEEEDAAHNLYLFDVVNHLEEAGDILSKNIVTLVRKKGKEDLFFSSEGLKEIQAFHDEVLDNFKRAMAAFTTGDRELAADVLRRKKKIRERQKELRLKHLSRLKDGLPETFDTSDIHLEILSNLRQFNSVVTRIVRPLVVNPDEDES